MSKVTASHVGPLIRRNPSTWKKSTQLIFVLIFALIGTALVLASHASNPVGPIVGIADKCLDNYDAKKVDFNTIDLWQCNSTPAQQWTFNPGNGTISNVNGYCLDVKADSTSAGTIVDLYQCNGTRAQIWAVNATAGTITSPQSGLCLDDHWAGTSNGNEIWMYGCNGTAAQHWKVSAVAPQPTPTPPPTPTVAPTITSSKSVTFTEGTISSFTVTDTGYPSPSLSEAGTLPAGIVFNTSNGVLSGTPTSAGTYSLTFTASNGVSPNATQTFTLTVNALPSTGGSGGSGTGSGSGSGSGAGSGTGSGSGSGSGTTTSAFRLFGPTSLWNTTKTQTGYVFATQATATIQSVPFYLNNGSFDHPLYIAKTTDPLTTFTLSASWGHPATTITSNAPSGMHQASGSDAVMDVLLTNGTLLDMYGVTGSGTSWKASAYGTSDGVNGPGFGTQPYTAIGTTGIGSPQAAGTLLSSDVAAGVVPHGLTMACDYKYLGGSGTSGGPQVPPAVSNDDGGGTGPLMEGGFLIIPKGAAMPSNLSTMGKQLWNAASTYGVYITDQAGGGCYFYGDGSAAVNNAFTSTDLNDVGHALELVNTWTS